MVICPLSRHASAWNYQSTEDIPKKECKKQQDTHRQLYSKCFKTLFSDVFPWVFSMFFSTCFHGFPTFLSMVFPTFSPYVFPTNLPSFNSEARSADRSSDWAATSRWFRGSRSQPNTWQNSLEFSRVMVISVGKAIWKTWVNSNSMVYGGVISSKIVSNI